MVLLIAFAFIAGIVTVLSPCILPVLPIVLSSTVGGKEIGKARPLGVVVGFILGFTFFTLFLSTIVSFLRIPADSLRLFAVIVIAIFGVSFLIPQFQVFLEKLFSLFSRFIPQGGNKNGQGFWSGLIIGLSIGLLWTPCVGPILASVISLAITGTITLSAIIITLAYAMGTAIPLLIVLIGGQQLLRKVPWLLKNTGNIQKGFGIVMILTAIAIFYNYDRIFQTFILNTFPQYGIGLTRFEDTEQIREQLKTVQEKGSAHKDEDMGKPMFDLLPKGTKAPELVPGGVWLNSSPLTLKQLKGKVILLDFWTYSCINCQRTLPYLRKWFNTYRAKGLIIIGVHSPEFAFEKNESNVAQAIKDFGLLYPVVQDNDFATWRAYDNHYWPAKYLIDKEGYIRYMHFGEGAYDETEKVIQELLQETGVTDVSRAIHNPQYSNYAQTPETYLGYVRIDRFVSPETIVPDMIAKYTAPAKISENAVAYEGSWVVREEYANPQKGAALLFNFDAKEVFLVMRTRGIPAKINVLLDGDIQGFGKDNHQGIVTVDADRLYKVINLEDSGRHILRLDFEDNNAELYAFTFG